MVQRYFIYYSYICKNCSSFRIFVIHIVVMHLPSIFIDPIRNKLIELSFALRKIYYQTKKYHQSAKRLLSDTQKEGYNFSLSDVKNWLYRQAIWQIHFPPSKYIP